MRAAPLRSIAAVAFAAALSLPSGSAAAGQPPATAGSARAPQVRNVIFMIPDGCGAAAVALARSFGGRPLTLDSMLVGAVETGSASSRVTDSAAGATAYASGVRTHNRVVGLDAAYRPVGTLLEAAQARGMRTGLVVRCPVTDATPAAFAAHAEVRTRADTIALQELDHRVDVMLGGGWPAFLPRAAGGDRADGLDLLAEARRRGFQVLSSTAELAGPLRTPLLGLFAREDMAYEIDRDPATDPGLAAMTLRALELLSKGPRGFFLMVEGSRIDHAAHENDAATMAREVLAFDAAVRAVVEFARRDGRTLVVSCTDHEAGGLWLGGHTDAGYAFLPESLFAQTASAGRMADSIRAGGVPAAVVARFTGAALTDEDRARLAAAAAADSGLLETIGAIQARRALASWGTTGHTAVDVGLYAFGPGAEHFRGWHTNAGVARRIAAVAGLDLDAATARLARTAPGAAAR